MNDRDSSHVRVTPDHYTTVNGPACLPPFPRHSASEFQWGPVSGADFSHVIHCAYSEIAHWRRNVFLAPSGNVGKRFVRELSALFNAHAQASAMEGVALEAIMVACALLLQKPHHSSKCRDHVAVLDRRLRAWQAGDIDGLLKEGRTIQKHLVPARRRPDEDPTANDVRVFSRLVFEGKIHSALRYLTENHATGVLHLEDRVEPSSTKTVRDVLRDKHPPSREVNPEALLSAESQREWVHPVLFDRLTGDSIRLAALRTQGAAGPSGIDAVGWRRLCTGFQRESADLCRAIAAFARRLCTSCVDPDGLRAFLACRLIPLNKNPGVRPIGICEVVRRIVGKAVMATIKTDVLQAVGPLQLCAGQNAGAEAAVHAIRTVFEDPDTDAVIFVDASNAFNNLNRQVALANIARLCPAISTVLVNCYRHPSPLFVGGSSLLSQEGTTQGDPLAMAMFALATVPLIRAVATSGTTQAWFADDAASGGKLTRLRLWWDTLSAKGPLFGYYPNAIKTYLLTKPDRLEEAAHTFAGTGVQITSEGRRYLGGALGSGPFQLESLAATVTNWSAEVRRLAQFATVQPHAAFAAFTHGLIGRWTYAIRVNPVASDDRLQALEGVISQVLIPALTGQPAPSTATRRLLALPARLGGLGIVNPAALPDRQQPASLAVCQPLVQLIRGQHPGDSVLAAHYAQRDVKTQLQRQQREHLQSEAAAVAALLPPSQRKLLTVSQERGASAWLAALPLERLGFSLHKGAFKDALALRYGWPIHLAPQKCVCGEPFDMNHALVCHCGGLPGQRHDRLRDLFASLLAEVCPNVTTEPALQPVCGECLPSSANREERARLDIKATNFWGSAGQDAFFDVRVFHPLASSYQLSSLAALYRHHEAIKRRQYGRRVVDVEHGSFTPLVATTCGGLAPAATVFLKRLANLLCVKRQESYGLTMGWLRCAVSFCLLRSAITCIRGSRRPPSKLDCNSIAEAVAGGRVPMVA